MNLKTGAIPVGGVCALLLSACSSATESSTDEQVGVATSADGVGDVLAGAFHFDVALPGTNGRSCATCHVPEDHFTLTPQHVTALYAQNPNDPLFNPIDADDPTAAVPTYDHLMAGLVRIDIHLADNLDVIDANGDVITNADRTVSVWRGVPTVENVTFTAPYQYDGRLATLPIQADGALHAHSQITYEPSPQVLDQISDFERTIFSDFRAAAVGVAFDEGQTPPYKDIPLPSGSDAAAGQVLFKNICATCHGTGTTNVVTNPAVQQSVFPTLNPDGTINYDGFNPNGGANSTSFNQSLHFPQNMGDYGIATVTMFGQIGFLPNPSGLTRPGYRIRFYTDATRTQKSMDLPPTPPAIGPAIVPEPFSVDPGRALVSGNPYDWEGFKILELRGISKTAPYFHDGSAPDLETVLDIYSRFILGAIPALSLPFQNPPEPGQIFNEALTPTQKAQLIAFLQHL
jgi:cytochrome c peroxidase